MKKKIKVSAVVPVFNSASYIGETIQSLKNQTKAFDEIIVVDDGSTDQTIQEIKKYKGIKIIKTKHQERSAARNKGWKAARGNAIAFIESDAIFDKHWLEEVLKGFEEGYSAIIDRRKVHNPQTFIAKMNDHFFDVRFKKYTPFNAWAMYKRVLQETGGFDETLKGPEDKDLGDRILQRGYRIYFAKKAIQYHKGEPKTLFESLKRSFFYGIRILPYWKKTKKIPLLKLLFFTGLITSVIEPKICGIGTGVYLLYVAIRDVIRGMDLQYLWFHPIYVLLNEIAATVGSWYGFLGGSMEKLR